MCLFVGVHKPTGAGSFSHCRNSPQFVGTITCPHGFKIKRDRESVGNAAMEKIHVETCLPVHIPVKMGLKEKCAQKKLRHETV